MFTYYNLDSFTSDTLRKYCDKNDLKSGGHKGEIMDRIKRHLKKQESMKQGGYETHHEEVYREFLASKREDERKKQARAEASHLFRIKEELEAKAMAEFFVLQAREEVKAEAKAREEAKAYNEFLLAKAKAKAEAEEEERLVKEKAQAKANAMFYREHLLAKAMASLF